MTSVFKTILASHKARQAMGEVLTQRDYFAKSALDYDVIHSDRDEHGVALAWLESLFQFYAFESYLEIGAGTGRHLLRLQHCFPNACIIGVEPVEAMRQRGYTKGIGKDALIDGDGYQLQFPDESFDVVAEFAVLHHVRYPERVIAEMLRVARGAIFISDSNNFGHGSLPARRVKIALRRLSLWPVFDWVRSGGKRYYISQGDGVAYSYSVFNNLSQIRRACGGGLHILNASPLDGPATSPDLLISAATVALLGLKQTAQR